MEPFGVVKSNMISFNSFVTTKSIENLCETPNENQSTSVPKAGDIVSKLSPSNDSA
jgi:hypothetical protein